MHPNFLRADELSREVIGAAVEVHRVIGPGLMESFYERCLIHELALRGLQVTNQQSVRVHYKTLTFDENLRFDLRVEGCVLLELKTVNEILPVHKAQLLTYMRLLNIPVGLLLNFHAEKLTEGLARMILPGANRS